MASDKPFTPIADGEDQHGVAWEVGVRGVRGRSLVVRLGEGEQFREVELTYSGRDSFAEAVARAVTPGASVKHGPGCGCTPCLAEPSYRAARDGEPDA